MARGKKPSKAQQRADRAGHLTPEKFMTFVAEAHASKQEVFDATTAHASQFKKADGLGIHTEAVKLFLKLDKMEQTKRADFLRAFDTYRAWATAWTEQPDILDEDAAGEAEVEGRFQDDPAATGGEAGEQDGGTEEREPLAASEAEHVVESNDGQPAPEADWGDDRPVLTDADSLTAGFTFAAGRQAAREGHGADANPHPENSPSHPIWARGHAQGLKDREMEAEEAAPAAEEAERVVEMPRGRRARRSPPVDAGAVAVY